MRTVRHYFDLLQNCGRVFDSVCRPLTVAAIACFLPQATSAQNGKWEQIEPKPTSASILGIASGNERMVAVCSDGNFLVSKDGTRWEVRKNPDQSGSQLNAITYAEDMFIAVGTGAGKRGYWEALVLTSKDGDVWTRRPVRNSDGSPSVSSLKGITYGRGRFVVVGDVSPLGLDGIYKQTVFSSEDGMTWTRRAKTVYGELTDVAFGGGKFIAVGPYNPNLHVSSDGIHWETQKLRIRGKSHPSGFSIAYGKGKFVLVGTHRHGGLIATSRSGNHWKEAPLPEIADDTRYLTLVEFCNDRFFSTITTPDSELELIASFDGIIWKEGHSGLPKYANIIDCFHFANDRFFIGSSFGLIADSLDGEHFHQVIPKAEVGDFADVAYGGGIYVAVGGNSRSGEPNWIKRSIDGKSWTLEKSGLLTPTEYTAIAYGNGKFVAVGGSQYFLGSSISSSSFDGIVWNNSKVYTEGNQALMPTDLAFGAGLFVAVGPNNQIFTSQDGLNWKPRASNIEPIINLSNVAWNGSRFVVVGGNFFATSTDGITWHPGTLDETAGYYWSLGSPNTLAVSRNGTFVLNSDRGIYTSRNGLHWNQTVPTPDYASFNNGIVCFGNGRFIMAPNSDELGYGTYISSDDGQTWTRAKNNAPWTLRSVVAGNGQFIGVGYGGAIYSMPFSNVRD